MTKYPKGAEVPYTITWLEMTAPPTYPRPSAPLGSPAALLKAHRPPVWFFLNLYDAVGRDYAWEDMFTEPEEELEAWIQDSENELFTLMRDGWPHGFFFLERKDKETCNLAYFGLVPQALSGGLGTFLLQSAIYRGWDWTGVKRMTVNTCDLDHPRALALYQKQGFQPIRRTDHVRTLRRPLDQSGIPR